MVLFPFCLFPLCWPGFSLVFSLFLFWVWSCCIRHLFRFAFYYAPGVMPCLLDFCFFPYVLVLFSVFAFPMFRASFPGFHSRFVWGLVLCFSHFMAWGCTACLGTQERYLINQRKKLQQMERSSWKNFLRGLHARLNEKNQSQLVKLKVELI